MLRNIENFNSFYMNTFHYSQKLQLLSTIYQQFVDNYVFKCVNKLDIVKKTVH